MGQCTSISNRISLQKSQVYSEVETKHPTKVLPIYQKNQILLQSSDGTVQTLEVSFHYQKLPQGLENSLILYHEIDKNCWINTKTQIFYISEFANSSDHIFLQSVFAYSHLKSLSGLFIPNILTVDSAFVIKKSNQISNFIIKSKPICATQRVDIGQTGTLINSKIANKFVNMISLGKYMKSKNIGWFDKEFRKVIRKVIISMKNMHKVNCYRVNNVLIGENEMISIMGGQVVTRESSLKNQKIDYKRIVKILFQSLTGKQTSLISKLTQSIIRTQLQENYPQCLKDLISLHNCSNLEVRFQNLTVQDLEIHSNYINNALQSYIVSNCQVSQRRLAKAYQALGFYSRAQQILIRLQRQSMFQDKQLGQTVQLHEQLIHNAKNIANANAEQYQKKLLEIYINQANRQLDEGNYLKSESLLSKANRLSEEGQLYDERVYIALSNIYLHINQYDRSQETLISGLRQLPSNKPLTIFLLQNILQQFAFEKGSCILNQSIKYIQFTDAQILYFKVKILLSQLLLTVSLNVNNNYEKCLRMVNTAANGLQKERSRLFFDSYIVKGDLNLYRGAYKEAIESFQNALLLLKADQSNCNQKRRQSYQHKFKTSLIRQSLANCYFLKGNYHEALNSYSQSLSKLSPQLTSRRAVILGNMGMIEALTQKQSEGQQTIRFALKQFQQSEKSNADYKFFRKRLIL